MHCALLSPPGMAALASIGIWGEGAEALLSFCFQLRLSGPLLPEVPRLGRFLADEASDEIVVLRCSQERVDRFEIFCHGGTAIVRGILARFVSLGAVESNWAKWIAGGVADRIAEEAEIALAWASTLTTVEHLLWQRCGALRREIVRLAALTDEPLLCSGLESLLTTSIAGLHLTQPWRVVVAGPVNAGKSSLINALVGYQRTITSPHPGTTRDLVSVQTAFEGWPVELIDTAGYRQEAGGVEAQGINQMRQCLSTADAILWVEEVGTITAALPEWVPPRNLIRIASKIDLFAQPPSSVEWLGLSAATGEGLDLLQKKLVRLLMPMLYPAGAPLLFHPRQVNHLANALEEVRRGNLSAATTELMQVIAEPIR